MASLTHTCLDLEDVYSVVFWCFLLLLWTSKQTNKQTNKQSQKYLSHNFQRRHIPSDCHLSAPQPQFGMGASIDWRLSPCRQFSPHLPVVSGRPRARSTPTGIPSIFLFWTAAVLTTTSQRDEGNDQGAMSG